MIGRPAHRTLRRSLMGIQFFDMERPNPNHSIQSRTSVGGLDVTDNVGEGTVLTHLANAIM
jgi:hypothetical protein